MVISSHYRDPLSHSRNKINHMYIVLAYINNLVCSGIKLEVEVLANKI